MKQYNAAWNNNGELVGLKIRFTDRQYHYQKASNFLWFDAVLFL
ncbi:hypothetical protein [Bacillus sp. EB106-08-02-XG196]|nr:hypothetical protein [Bacillus sp. EB106-08-02-XG196]